MLVGIVERYTLLYIIGGIIGASLLMLFNGPNPRNVACYIGLIGVHCNLFVLGIVYHPLCPVLGCATMFGEATTVVF